MFNTLAGDNMTNFKRHARYDPSTAFDGKWFLVDDEMGNEHGEFRCALVEVGSPRWIAAAERAENDTRVKPIGNGYRKPKKLTAKETAEASDRQFIKTFCDMALLDWRGIEDGNGKAVPFSKDAAIEYFDVTDQTALYVFRTLAAQASDVRNFQPESQDGELPEGN